MNRRGFTLIELVLSLSLVAVLLLVALSSVRFGAGLWESGNKTADRGWIKRYFTTVFHAEVSSAFPYAGPDGDIVFSGRPERLVFVSTGFGGVLPWGGARLVEYVVQDGCLVLKERVLPDAVEKSQAKVTELSKDVERVVFSYLGAAGWEDGWEGSEKKSVPKAIKAAVFVKGVEKAFEFSAPVMLNSIKSGAE